MMKKVGLVVNSQRANATSIARELIGWLLKKKCEVYIEDEAAKNIGQPDLGCLENDLVKKIDLLVALGGDGTLLYGAHLVKETDIPILGLNLGSLGFLTGITQEELYSVLSSVLEDIFEYDQRMMLKAEVIRKGSSIASFKALNDVSINMGTMARVITLDISIEGEYLGTYAADGVVVATPTGSTAYSLSAGGPILNPQVEALILTPICPHTLAIRPMVVPTDQSIEVIVKESPQGAILTIDGQKRCPLNQGDRVLFGKAERGIRLVKSKKGFYELVRTKLSWGGLPEREGWAK